MTKSDYLTFFYEVAKIIDNDFIGSLDSFSVKSIGNGFLYLDTNKCDSCSEVRVKFAGDEIDLIERLGPNTDGWQQIHEKTMERVTEFIKNNPLPF